MRKFGSQDKGFKLYLFASVTVQSVLSCYSLIFTVDCSMVPFTVNLIVYLELVPFVELVVFV